MHDLLVWVARLLVDAETGDADEADQYRQDEDRCRRIKELLFTLAHDTNLHVRKRPSDAEFAPHTI